MADEDSQICQFARLPEEIVEKILCFLWSNYEQDIARLVCRSWNRLLLRIRQQRHQILINAIKTGKLHYQKYDNCSRVGPSPRSSHSSCVLAGNLCVFGGCSPSNTAYNDFYIFNVTERKWTKLTTSGLTPVPRECATLVGYRGNVVLFGGCCQPPRSSIHLHGKFFNGVHVLNFHDKSWAMPDCGSIKPCQRAGHSASVVANTMVVFGGAQGERRFSDVWYFNLETKKWQCPNISGKKPPERFGQSQVTISDQNQKIIIIGGCGLANTIFSDVWLLDLPRLVWHEIEVRDRIYAAPHIWSHPAIMVGDWLLVFASPTRTRDISAAASLMTGIPLARMKMYTMECNELETNYRCSWRPVPSNHMSAMAATSLHTVNVCDDIIFIFGGLGNREDARTATNTLVCVTSFWSKCDLGK